MTGSDHMAVGLVVSLPHGAVGWSVVCDFGISWSYLLAFWIQIRDRHNVLLGLV